MQQLSNLSHFPIQSLHMSTIGIQPSFPPFTVADRSALAHSAASPRMAIDPVEQLQPSIRSTSALKSPSRSTSPMSRPVESNAQGPVSTGEAVSESPRSTGSRRNSGASIGTARRAEAATAPLLSTAQLDRGRKTGGTEDRQAAAGKRAREEQEMQVDEDEDELDPSDLESEEGGGQPTSGGTDGQAPRAKAGARSKRVDMEKDAADFAYEYVPVTQRRENRDKM